MESRYAWLVGGIGGVAVGYLFGVRPRGDIWFGSVLAVVWTVTIYGFFAFPEYRTRWAGSHSGWWYTLIGTLPPLAILLAPMGPTLADSRGLPAVLFFGGLWLGGVYAGVALERSARADSGR